MALQSKHLTSWTQGSDNLSDEHIHDDKHDRRNAWTRWVEDGWLIEVCSLTLGCVLLLALCLVLNNYNGKPVPDLGATLGGVVTLNTIVAIIAVFVQACLLFPTRECLSQLKWHWLQSADRRLDDLHTFDKASGGFIGSFVLLYRIRWSKMGSFGALLLISAFTIAPFLQQLIAVVQQPVTTIDSRFVARLPVLRRYSESTGLGDVITIRLGTASAGTLSTGMRGAVEAGFYAVTDLIRPLEPTCSTGNCTFAPYQSLAVCVTVANLTNSLGKQEYSADRSGVPTAPSSTTSNETRFELANRYYLLTARYQPASGVLAGDGTGAYVNVSNVYYRDSVAFNNTSAPLGGAMIMAARTPGSAQAYEAKFDWCLQTYETTVSNGIANTTVVKSELLGNASTSIGYDIGFRDYLVNLFNGSVTYSSGDVYATSSTLQAMYEPLRTLNTTGLETMLSNIATSATNYMRSSGDSRYENNTVARVDGTVFRETSIVQIRWNWIIGPALFAGLSVFFVLASTIRVANGGTRYAWKSNSSAMLHALDPQLQESMRGLKEPSRLRPMDHKTMVRMVKVSDTVGWRIVPRGEGVGQQVP